MKNYSLIITSDAEHDLKAIRSYLENELFMPNAALNYIQALRSEIKRLEYIATAFAIVPEEPGHSAGIRRILVKQFYVYYFVNETENTVYILNIIYAKMEQRNVLSKLSDLFFKTDKEN